MGKSKSGALAVFAELSFGALKFPFLSVLSCHPNGGAIACTSTRSSSLKCMGGGGTILRSNESTLVVDADRSFLPSSQAKGGGGIIPEESTPFRVSVPSRSVVFISDLTPKALGAKDDIFGGGGGLMFGGALSLLTWFGFVLISGFG